MGGITKFQNLPGFPDPQPQRSPPKILSVPQSVGYRCKVSQDTFSEFSTFSDNTAGSRSRTHFVTYVVTSVRGRDYQIFDFPGSREFCRTFCFVGWLASHRRNIPSQAHEPKVPATIGNHVIFSPFCVCTTSTLFADFCYIKCSDSDALPLLLHLFASRLWVYNQHKLKSPYFPYYNFVLYYRV